MKRGDLDVCMTLLIQGELNSSVLYRNLKKEIIEVYGE